MSSSVTMNYACGVAVSVNQGHQCGTVNMVNLTLRHSPQGKPFLLALHRIVIVQFDLEKMWIGKKMDLIFKKITLKIIVKYQNVRTLS